MKASLKLLLPVAILVIAGCSSTNTIISSPKDLAALEKATSRGILSAGPLIDIPEETVKDMLKRVEDGQCPDGTKVRFDVEDTTFLGITFSKKVKKYGCEI